MTPTTAALWEDPDPKTPEGRRMWAVYRGNRDAGQRICQIEAEAVIAERARGVDALERGYTIIVSAIPALYRAWRDSPNPSSAPLNRLLLDAAIGWVTTYQREHQGREPDDFSEYDAHLGTDDRWVP